MADTKAGAFLPYGRQVIEDDDIAAVAQALRADLLTTGPRVAAFEEAFAANVGRATRWPALTARQPCIWP